MSYEAAIVWLYEGAKERPFLREVVDEFAVGRTAPITGKNTGRDVVAYSVLVSTAKAKPGMRGRFVRRYWYNNADDATAYAEDGWCRSAPIEAVLPESVKADTQGVAAGPVLRAMPRRWP